MLDADKMFRFTPTVSSSQNIFVRRKGYSAASVSIIAVTQWWTGSSGFCKQRCILDPSSTPWYTPEAPPIALFWGSRDYLCDGAKLRDRLEGVEAKLAGVRVIAAREIEGCVATLGDERSP